MHIDGKWFLAAMIVIYETFARLSDATKLSRRGWDQGYAIAIATAAGICNLLGLSPNDAGNAIGIAATSNLPLRVTRSGELTAWKNVATAYAARNGVFAALLAAEGMSGPGNAFEGRNGLFENVTGPFDLAPFPNDGGGYLTPRVQMKYWPIETNGQPAVWAALELRTKAAPTAWRQIDLFTSKFTWFEIGSEPEKWDPQTRETADHSIPYLVAAALQDGGVTPATFEPRRIQDPALRPLIKKLTVVEDPEFTRRYPAEARTRVEITTPDGRSMAAETAYPKGHRGNPLSDAEVEAKFRGLAAGLSPERCDRLLAEVWHLDEAATLDGLLESAIVR